jgi:hypothetical protein
MSISPEPRERAWEPARDPVGGSKTIDLEAKRVKDGCGQLSGNGETL